MATMARLSITKPAAHTSRPLPTAIAPQYTVGSVVEVESRTQPGINKSGGVGRITRVFPAIANSSDTHSSLITYSIKYVLGGSERRVAEEYVHQVGFLDVRRTPKPVDFFGDLLPNSAREEENDIDSQQQQQRRSSRRELRSGEQGSECVGRKRVRTSAPGDNTVILNLILKTKSKKNKKEKRKSSNSNRSSSSDIVTSDDEIVFAPVARVAKQSKKQRVSNDQVVEQRDGNKIKLSVKGMKERSSSREGGHELISADSAPATPQSKQAKKKGKKQQQKLQEQDQEQEQQMLLGNLSPQSTRSNDTAMTPTLHRTRGGEEWDIGRGMESPLTPMWNSKNTGSTAVDDGYSPKSITTGMRAHEHSNTRTTAVCQRRMLSSSTTTSSSSVATPPFTDASAATLLLNVRSTLEHNNNKAKKRERKRLKLQKKLLQEQQKQQREEGVAENGEVEVAGTPRKNLSTILQYTHVHTKNDKLSLSASEKKCAQPVSPKSGVVKRKKKVKKNDKTATVLVNVKKNISRQASQVKPDEGEPVEWLRGQTIAHVAVETSLKSALRRADMIAKTLLREALADYEHPNNIKSRSDAASITSDNTSGSDEEEEEEEGEEEDDEDDRADVSSFLRRTFKQHHQERAAMAKGFMEQYRRLKQHWVTQLQHEGLIVQGADTTTRLLSNSLNALCRRVQPGYYSSREVWASRASLDGTKTGRNGNIESGGYKFINQVAVQEATRHASERAVELVRNQNMESQTLSAQQRSAVLEVLEDYRVRHGKVCALVSVGVPLLFPNLELTGPTLVVEDEGEES